MSIEAGQLMKSLLSKLYITVTGRLDESMPEDRDNYVTWLTPGIPFKSDFFNFANTPIPTGIPEAERGAIAKRYADCANEWAILANFVPSGQPLTMSNNFKQAIWHSSQELLWNLFDEVLRMSQVATSQLSEDEKAKIEKFRNLLAVKKEKENLVSGERTVVTEDGPVVVAYKQKMKDWLAASMAYKHAEVSFHNAESVEAVNTWRFMEPILREAVKSAKDDWVTNGYKNEVDEMRAYINQITQRNMTLIKANVQDKFEKGLQTGSIGQYYYTSVIPGDFMSSEGWTGFYFNEKSYNGYSSHSETTWGGNVNVMWGLWSLGANASSSTERKQESFESDGFQMSFEIAQVPIARGWFDPSFLIGRGWKWSRDYLGNGDLSDGKIPPSGRLVAYPTTALFVRKVTLNSTSLQSNWSKYESHLSAGGSFGYGPFSIGGNYSESQGSERTNWRFDSEGLHIDGVQLIGFICRFLGKSPNPSPQAIFD